MKALLLVSLLTSLVASAQEELPPKFLRYVALGQLPPWKEEILSDRRIQLPPEPGQMPPNEIWVNGGDYSGISRKLYLKRLTNYFSFDGEQTKLEILDKEGGAVWFGHPMPNASHTLAILFRDLNEMTWFKPVAKVVRDDLQAFPLGTMRLVNVSHMEVVVKVGEEAPVFIKPGESSHQTLQEGNNLVIVDVVGPGGETRTIYQNDIPMKKGRRVQSFVYKSQGASPSIPVRFTHQIDRFKNPQSLFKSKEKPATGPVSKPADADNS